MERSHDTIELPTVSDAGGSPPGWRAVAAGGRPGRGVLVWLMLVLVVVLTGGVIWLAGSLGDANRRNDTMAEELDDLRTRVQRLQGELEAERAVPGPAPGTDGRDSAPDRLLPDQLDDLLVPFLDRGERDRLRGQLERLQELREFFDGDVDVRDLPGALRDLDRLLEDLGTGQDR